MSSKIFINKSIFGSATNLLILCKEGGWAFEVATNIEERGIEWNCRSIEFWHGYFTIEDSIQHSANTAIFARK